MIKNLKLEMAQIALHNKIRGLASKYLPIDDDYPWFMGLAFTNADEEDVYFMYNLDDMDLENLLLSIISDGFLEPTIKTHKHVKDYIREFR